MLSRDRKYQIEENDLKTNIESNSGKENVSFKMYIFEAISRLDCSLDETNMLVL